MEEASLDNFHENYNALYINYIKFLNKNGLTINHDEDMIEENKYGKCEEVKSILDIRQNEFISRINHQYIVFQKRISKLRKLIKQ